MNQQVAYFSFSCIDLGLVNTYLLLAALESPKTAYFRPKFNVAPRVLNPMARSRCCPGLSYVGIACLDLSLLFFFFFRDLYFTKSGASVLLMIGPYQKE